MTASAEAPLKSEPKKAIVRKVNAKKSRLGRAKKAQPINQDKESGRDGAVL